MNNWLYDEFKHCGVDYAKAEQAEKYDGQHSKFRNYEKEFARMLEFLEIRDTKDKIIIDMGCGTGAVSIYAADLFKAVYAIDVSDVMIEQARKKVANNDNLKFVNAGFLSYKHEYEQADLVVTKAALHHLPDFWKQIALIRVNQMLKNGGQLYIHDVVYHFEPCEYLVKINAWISELKKVGGEEFGVEVETHIRDEYSTFNWIMAGILEKAGFVIEKCESDDGFVTEYACRKNRELKW